MPSLVRSTFAASVLLSAGAWLLAGAATPAWVEDWAANEALIYKSVQVVPELEQSADAFAASVDAAIASGTSDVALTKMLMDFLIELDDDPRFQGFAAAANEASSTSSSSGGSTSSSTGSLAAGDSPQSDAGSSNAATAPVNAVFAVAAVALAAAVGFAA